MKKPIPARLARRENWTLGLRALGQVVLSVVVLGAMYFLVPTQDPGQGSDLPWLLLELGLFAVVVALQIPAIIHARFPVLRAAITLGVLVPLYLLVFARLYLSSSRSSHGRSEPWPGSWVGTRKYMAPRTTSSGSSVVTATTQLSDGRSQPR